MISSKSEAFLRRLDLISPLLRTIDLENMRRAQDAIGMLGARVLHDDVAYAPIHFDHFEGEWIYPLNIPRPGIILYLHGGAYTAGGLPYAKGFGSVLAHATLRKTLCIGYRLAPEHPFPAALDDAVAAYRQIKKAYPTAPVALIGESAGGGLCFAAALRIKELSLGMPSAIVALSPWTDLSCSGESCLRLAKQDPTLNLESLRQSARYYAGENLSNPLVSPLFGNLSGLPNTLIFAGEGELLSDDSVRITKKLRQFGVNTEFYLAEDMWHAYVLYRTPEAEQALMRINEFLEERFFASTSYDAKEKKQRLV